MKTASTPSWGSCPPTEMVVPDYGKTLLDECVEVNAAGNLDLFEWQKAVLAPWLAVAPSGRWQFPTLGNEVPRQNGKTVGVTCARAQFGMLKRWPVLGGRGERVLYTSHLQKTSTETFEFMAEFFDSTPAIRKHVKAIRSALGRESIVMKNGGRIKFLARTRNGGRGQHADLLIFDEALDITQEEHASFLPVVSASPNPQTVFTSTPPTEDSSSEPYAAVRKNALSGRARRTVWHGWGVKEMPPAGSTPDDLMKMAWETNPSMGTLIDPANIMAEIEQTDDLLGFAVERLGYWVEPKRAESDRAVPEADWEACGTDSPAGEGVEPDAYGVKFSPDGSEVAVAVCIRNADMGLMRLELAADRSTAGGTRWIRNAMLAHPEAMWMVDGKSGATSVVEAVEPELGPNVVLCRPGDAISAASGLLDSLRDREAEIYAKPGDRLSGSAAASTRRKIGTGGGWGFGGDSAPVEAVALALLGAKRGAEAREEDMEVWF